MANLTVGIGGASRSGKTTLARQIRAYFRDQYKTVLFHQDEFIVAEEDIPRIRTETDWEHPASIDFDRLVAAVRDAKTTYDLTIVEGFLLYSDARLYQMFDRHYFLEIDEETFFKRRREDRRYGTDEEWYIRHTWASFLKYGWLPDELGDDVIVLSQDYNPEDVIAQISAALKG